VKVIHRLPIAGLLSLALTGSPVFAAPSSSPTHAKVDNGVQASLRSGVATQQVIITVVPGHRAEMRAALEKHGDRIKADHPLLDALSVELHTSDVNDLANHPWVLEVSLDALVSSSAAAAPAKGLSTTSSGTLRETLGLPRIATSTTLTGSSGVGVAIIDSGIAPSSDFNGRITGFWDFTRGGIPVAPFDDYGHGTHVAGLIGSSGAASNYEFQGIAPEVRLVGLKVLDANGQGKTSDVIRAIEFVVANKSKLNVQIINLSLGHPILAPASQDPLVQAVERATQAGLIVVTAAGNNGQKKNGQVGYTGITSPGNAPSAITVGAAITNNTVVRGDDTVADFSSRGPTWFDGIAKPNVVAPGYQLAGDTSLSSTLFNLLPSGRVKTKNGADFLSLSGTSMATAVTSGVVALVVDAHNKSGFHRQKPLTANLVKGMLEFSAIPMSGADLLSQGTGEINAGGAIALASAIDTSDNAGYWVRSSVPGFTIIGGQTAVWSQNIVWGDTVFTGNLLYVSNIVWTSNIVWDANIVWDSSVAYVRASNIVWDSDAVWGANIVWSDRVIGQMNGDNIVWGSATGDNIVWGSLDGDNIVWGSFAGDNIVWGTFNGDNIVWGSFNGDNIVWGSFNGDNIVWGSFKTNNIVWDAIGNDMVSAQPIGGAGDSIVSAPVVSTGKIF
jgi:serine protease AprX